MRQGRGVAPRLLPPLPSSGAAAEPVAAAERHPLAGRVLCVFIVLLGGLALWSSLSAADSWWRAIGLNTVIVALVLLGLVIYGTPQRYGRAFGASVGEAGGILLQFPFYFGILGVLEASGMVELLARNSADLARGLADLGLPLQWSFDMVTFSSAGLVNLFVPSGGGQWAVQGPIVMQAAADAGVDPGKMVMALAYGDELTNMLQPFWALPLLAIAGVKARDIVGYTAIAMVFALVWMVIGLLLF